MSRFDPSSTPSFVVGWGGKRPADGVAGEGDVLIPFLYACSPNPFAGHTAIRWQTPGQADVELRLFDMTGRLVRTLHDGRFGPGRYVSHWDGRDNAGRKVAAGIYVCRFCAGSYMSTRKVVMTATE